MKPLFILTIAVAIASLVPDVAAAQRTAGEHVDDTTVTARVKYALMQQSVENATDINVETARGVVQLSGWLNTERAKDIAAEVARGTEGVVAVSNRLKVKSGSRSAGRVLDDTLLAAKVKLALTESDETSGMRINVEVRSADVELSGFVDSYAERDAAIELVENIDGVHGVINAIDITPQR